MNWNQWFRKTGQWINGTTDESPAATLMVPCVEPSLRQEAEAVSPGSRYCAILSQPPDDDDGERQLANAWRTLESAMAVVPGGETDLVVPVVATGDGNAAQQKPIQRIRVRSIYIDRMTVTNAEFAAFVAAGGYREPEYWPPQILPQVLQFVDRTGIPSPREWRDGQPPSGKRDHPVVGVSWYEARAYALWVGKRLPTSAEWQRAACWCDGDGDERRYPWGNTFSPDRANTWLSGVGDTAPSASYYDGCTPNGIYQLVGNVWEWTATAFDCETDSAASEVLWDHPMAEIRGGAFDTYFETQATCQFRSGQSLLHRGTNVGFRCCVTAETLRRPEPPAPFFEKTAP